MGKGEMPVLGTRAARRLFAEVRRHRAQVIQATTVDDGGRVLPVIAFDWRERAGVQQLPALSRLGQLARVTATWSVGQIQGGTAFALFDLIVRGPVFARVVFLFDPEKDHVFLESCVRSGRLGLIGLWGAEEAKVLDGGALQERTVVCRFASRALGMVLHEHRA